MVLEQSAPIETAPLQWMEVPEPWPDTGEIRIKISCAAICPTDLHVIEEALPRTVRPLIPGHQAVGIVDALGKNTKKFRLGSRVGAAWLRKACRTCSFCVSGSENLCESCRFMGYHEHGAFAEYVVVPEDFAYEIPSGLSPAETVPLMCAGITGYRALKRSALPKEGTLGLFGFGPSAHIALQIAKSRGSRVFVITRGANQRELAKRLGADWVGDTAFGLPRKLDSAILFSSSGEVVPPALLALRHGGTLAIASTYLTPIPPLDYEKHLFYEKSLISVTATTREDGKELLEEAAAAGLKPPVIAYPLREANQALLDLKNERLLATAILKM